MNKNIDKCDFVIGKDIIEEVGSSHQRTELFYCGAPAESWKLQPNGLVFCRCKNHKISEYIGSGLKTLSRKEAEIATILSE